MKIYNIQPVLENEYIFNPEQITKTYSAHSYVSSFDFNCDIVETINTLTISYDLQYLVGGDFEDVVIAWQSPNRFEVEIGGIVEDGDIFLAYNCSCQFNFETEGVDADVLSLADFLNNFYAHITKFLSRDGFEAVKEKEEETRIDHPLDKVVLDIIDTLQRDSPNKN